MNCRISHVGQRSMWADWGPMYALELQPDQQLHITSTDLESGQQEPYAISPASLTLGSPPLAEVRARHPFYLEVTDAARGLKLLGYFDESGEETHVVVKHLHPGLSALPLIFPISAWAEVSRIMRRDESVEMKKLA